jgi:hypothetical protein
VSTDRAILQSALRRNLSEVDNAIIKKRALTGMHSANSRHVLDFFVVAAHALYSDMMAHAMRALDPGAGSGSFWHLHRLEQRRMEEFAAQRDVSISMLLQHSQSLQRIRSKTNFHIDRAAVMEPSEVWKAAGLSDRQLGWALTTTHDLLADLQEQECGERPRLPDYDGSDAARIIRAFKARHPDASLLVQPPA